MGFMKMPKDNKRMEMILSLGCVFIDLNSFIFISKYSNTLHYLYIDLEGFK